MTFKTTEALDAMHDKQFEAYWEDLTEAAAQHAMRTGEDQQLEEVMLAHNDAINARWPV